MTFGCRAAVWATTAHRHGGYVDLGTQTYHTSGYGLASRQIELYTATGGWDVARSLFGTVRLRVTSTPGGTPVFAGVAPAAAADRYLSGVAYATVTGAARDRPSGGIFLIGGALLVVLPVRGASRQRAALVSG